MKRRILFFLSVITVLSSACFITANARTDNISLIKQITISAKEQETAAKVVNDEMTTTETVDDGTEETPEDSETPDYEEPACRTDELISLDGKTIMMVGNSMLYYGNCVIYGGAGKADKGYFYQLIASNGERATVLDHTYSGKTLDYIYKKHLVNIGSEKLACVDYVVVAEANKPNDHLLETCKKIKALFPERTKLIFMCNPMMYYDNIESLLSGVSDLRGEGIEIVDWGRLVCDVYNGKLQVPGSKMKYDICTFIKDNIYVKDNKGNLLKNPNGGDNKHPNPLSGYISAQMLYSAITNRSALYSDYSFCNNSAINTAFDIDAFALKHYTGDKTTNFTDVLRSPSEMFAIQKLIDIYLAEEGKHLLYVLDAVEPTCTSGGLSQGYFCSVCGETVKEQEYIQSRGGHKIIYVKAVAPTCTKAGKSGSAYCSVCKEQIVKAENISATGHSDTVVLKHATMTKNGRKTVNCTVCKSILSDVKISKIAEVSLSKSVYIYDGKKKKPKVEVKAADGKLLVRDKDYTVTYPAKSVKIGNYTVRVDFKGNYSGSELLTLKIIPGATKSVTSESHLNSISLRWKKVSKATGYRIYIFNTETKKYEKYADTDKTALKVKKLKSGEKYKFRVKAFTEADGKRYFSTYYKNITAVTRPTEVRLKSVHTEKSGQAVLKWNRISGADGYQIAHSNSPKFKKAKKITVDKRGAKIYTVKKLKPGKKYFFKVRAYKVYDGKKIYGPYSLTKNANIK